MTDLTPHLHLLGQKPSWLSGPRRDDRIAALRAIAEHGEFPVISQMFMLVYDSDSLVASEAANTISHLLNKVSESEWARLCDSLHAIYLGPENVGRLTDFPAPVAVDLLGVASLNMSGYVRQAALEALGRLNSRKAWPFAILRLADWVPNVRCAAERLVDGLLAQGQLEDLLRYGRLIQGLKRVERVDLSGVQRKIVTALCAKRPPDEVIKYLAAVPAALRASFYELLISGGLIDESLLVEEALGDKAFELRLWALRRLPVLRPANMATLLQKLLTDKAASVRLTLLRFIPEDLWPPLEAQVVEMVWDDAPNVREAARFYLSRRGYGDFAARCRERLDAERVVTAGLIAGLAETGVRTDLPRIAAQAGHPKPRVREAVLVGLGRLDLEAAVDLTVAAVSDASGRVRRAAVQLLIRAGTGRAREKLLPVLEGGQVQARLAALAALSEMGKWEALRDMLFAVVSNDQALSEKAWEYLERWMAHYSIRLSNRPDSELAAELKQLMQRVPPPQTNEYSRRNLWRNTGGVVDWALQGR